jgi:hypothetical protein
VGQGRASGGIRPEVGEDQSSKFFHRIEGLPDLTAEVALGFGRLLQTVSVDVEEPTVISAANTLLLDIAVLERTASMSAVKSKQTRTAFAISKED